MNSLLQKYRELFPDDARSDATVLLDLGDKYPDKVALFPDAKIEYETLVKQRDEAMAPGVFDYARNIGGSVVRGLVNTAASVPKSIATGGAALERKYPVLSKVNDILNTTDVGEAPEDRPLHRIAEKMESASPEVQPGMEKSFWATKVPEGAGSSASFLVGGLAGKALKIPEALGIAGLGAMAQAQQGYEDAKSKGATDDQAFQSFLLNAGVGTSEAFPLSRMLKRLDGWSGGTLKKAIIGSAKEGLEEAVQEAFQSAAGDAIAKHIVKYDPNRKMFDDLASDSGAGFVTGFLMSALTHTIGHKLAREEPAKPEQKPTAEINPVESYQITPEVRGKINRVVEAELSGDSSLSHEAARAAIYADPEQHALYASELRRRSQEADLARGYADEARRQQEQSDQQQANEQRDAQNRADLEEQTGRTIQLAQEQNLADEESKARTRELYESQNQAAPTVEAPVPAPAAVSAPLPTDAIAKARSAAVNVTPTGPGKMPWEMTQAEAIAAYPAVPPAMAAKAHRAWIEKALNEGKAIAPEVMADYPDVQKFTPVTYQPAQNPEVTAPVALAESPTSAAPPKASVPEPVSGPDVVTSQAAGEETAPTSFDVADVDFEDAGTQVGESSRGSSKETLPAFYQIADGTDAGDRLGGLVSKFSPELGEVLTRQASKDSKLSKNWTHRLTAFTAPDGSVVMLGTFKRAGKDGGYFVADPNAPGKKSVPLSKLMDAGYKPFSSLRLKTAANNPAFKLTKAAYDEMSHTIESAKQETERTGAAVEEGLTGVTQPEGLAAVGKETVRLEPKLKKLAGEPLFSTEEAGKVYDALAPAVDGSLSKAVYALVSNKELTTRIAQRMAARLIANGTINNQLSQNEARDIVLDQLADTIERAYEGTNSREEFTAAVNLSAGVPGGGQEAGVAGSGPTGAGGAANSQEAEQGTKAEVESAAAVTDPSPTEGQKSAGNYRKGHVDIHGLDVTIENAKGSTRSGVGPDGKPWTVEMPTHYGYVRGTEAIDGDHVDVYIGDNPDSPKVWVVDQIDPKTKRFDEHKAMLGFNSKEEALSTYLRAFSDGSGSSRIGEITQMTMDDFRDWVSEGDTKKPLSYGKKYKPSLRYRTQQESENRATSAEVVEKFYSALDGLAAAGIDVNLITQRIGRTVIQFGSYDNAIDAITLSLADINNPTVENLIYLLHEAGHGLFARESPQRQAMITEAIKRITDRGLGIEGTQLSAQNQEERLVEAGAQELVRRGFNPAEALGVWQQIMRFVKDFYYRAMLWVQQARFGKDHVRPDLAQAYFNNRLEAMVSGQSSISWINFIGGRVRTFGEQVGSFDHNSVLPERFDVATGEMVYGDLLVDSAAAARLKYRTPSFVTDPVSPVSSDLDATAIASRDVAAQNTVDGVMKLVYSNWTSLGHNPSGLSYNDFVQSGNFISVETMPEDVIRAVNDSLAAAGKPGVTPTVDLRAMPNDSMRQRAAAVAHRILDRMRTDMADRRSEAESNLSPKNSKNLIDQLARLNQRINDLRTKYTNADLVLSDAKTDIGNLLNEFRDDLKDIKNESRRVGVLTQIIRGLETRMDRPALKHYEVALNRLFSAMTGERTARFNELLDRVANMPGIDWSSDSAKSIRDALQLIAPTDPVLAPLVNPDIDSRALFSVVVAFGRTNSYVMDLLRLRRSDAIDERIKVNGALSMAMTDSADAVREARKLIRDLPRLGAISDRLLRKIDDHRSEARDLHDAIMRDQRFIDFHHDNAPLWRQQMAKLEQIFGASTIDWEPTHGAEYMVPSAVNATIAQVESSKRVFDLSPSMVGTRLLDDLGKMKAWLGAVPANERGATWSAVKQQYDKLSLVDARFNHDAIKPSLVNRLIGSMTDRLDYVGTPAARQVAMRLRRMVSMQQSFTRNAEALGFRWGAAEGDAMKALGFHRGWLGFSASKRDAFRRMFYDRGLKFIENRQDIQAKHRDDAAAQTEVLKELKTYLERDPETASMMRNPKTWISLERLFRVTGEASSHLDALRKEMGIKLIDQSDGYRYFRESIGAPLFTVMRGFSKAIDRTFNQMLPGWNGSATPKLTAGEVATSYNTDRTALMTEMQARFDAETVENFVRPLVMRSGRSVFYAPPLPGGIQNMAMRERVIKAFERSRGNMVIFAEELYRLHAGTSDMGDYVGEVLSTFQSFFNQVQSVMQDHAEAIRPGIPVPPRLLMDARKSEEFPAEWLDYRPYDPHEMKNIVKLLAYEAGFGRDMKGMRSDLTTAFDEQKKLADRFEVLTQKALATTGGKTNRAFRDALKTLAGGSDEVAKLRAAERNAGTIKEMDKQFTKLLEAQTGVPIEFRAWTEVLQTLTAMTVQGPGTALTDTVSAFEQPLRKMGVNSITVMQMLRTSRSMVTEALGTLLQAFGHQIGINADNVKRRVELGYRDTDSTLKLKDKLRAVLNMPTSATSAPARAAVATARAVRTVLGAGVGKANGDLQYATLKPQAVFTQVGQWTHSAVIDGVWATFEDLISRAVKHFETSAGAADMADLAFRFDSKTLGYGKGFMGLFNSDHAFNYLVETLQRFGFSVETLAREAVIKRKTDPTAPFLTHHQYQVLAALGQNEITLESNITNRPPSFLTNPVLYAASPLVGWTVSKANEVAKGFREANGKLAWKTFGVGMMAYAGILPLSLAYAWLREEWDEDIQGKKANVMGYGGESNTFLAMLDKLGRVGTFGVFGDALNSALNQDTNRQFSVDSRVFFVSSTLQALNSLGTWWRQGDATYATVGRPLLQALGGSGYLQYADALNNALGLDNAEARVVKRVNVSNFMRSAGRELGMDVMTGRGSAALPNPIKPWVSEMYLASLSNDASGFRSAYRNAIAAARDEKKPDAEDFVKRSFASYNPLRTVFRTEPSIEEYQKLLTRMDDQGRATVQTAIRLYNGYASQLGIKEDYGRKSKPSKGSPFSLDVIRQRAVGL